MDLWPFPGGIKKKKKSRRGSRGKPVENHSNKTEWNCKKRFCLAFQAQNNRGLMSMTCSPIGFAFPFWLLRPPCHGLNPRLERWLSLSIWFCRLPPSSLPFHRIGISFVLWPQSPCIQWSSPCISFQIPVPYGGVFTMSTSSFPSASIERLCITKNIYY